MKSESYLIHPIISFKKENADKLRGMWEVTVMSQ